jgi:hypothetical protein
MYIDGVIEARCGRDEDMSEEGNGPVLEPVGSFNELERAAKVFVSGDRAFVVSDNPAELGDPQAPVLCKLYIIDVSDPKRPVLCASYESPGALVDVTASGNFVYLAETPASRPEKEGHGFSWNKECGGLRVLDISDPKGPREVGFFHTEGLVRACGLRDDKVYLVIKDSPNFAFLNYKEGGRSIRGRLHVIDVSDPKGPREVGRFDSEHGFRGIRLHKDRAFIISDIKEENDEVSGLFVIDISDPKELKEVISIDHYADDRDVFISGDLAYLVQEGATRTSSSTDWDYFHGGLRVINVTDIKRPEDVGWVGQSDMKTVVAEGIVVVNEHALIAHHGGIQVIDIADPRKPKVAGAYPTKGSPRAICYYEGLVYVADGTELGIYRLSPCPSVG